MRVLLIAVWIVGVCTLAGQIGCAPRPTTEPSRQELLLAVTAHVLTPEEQENRTTNQAVVVVRVMGINKALADRLPVKWQPLTVAEQNRRAVEQPPLAWAESKTVGWAETVRRNSTHAQWAMMERSEYNEVTRIMRGSTEARFVTAPRLTLFSDQMAPVACLTRRGFTRPDDPPGPPEQNIGRVMVHIKSRQLSRVYLDWTCGKGLNREEQTFIEATLSPQAPPDASFVFTEDPADWRIDVDRICVVTDVPEGAVLVIRCPDFRVADR